METGLLNEPSVEQLVMLPIAGRPADAIRARTMDSSCLYGSGMRQRRRSVLRSQLLKDTSALVTGSIVASLLAYVLLGIGTRAFGSARFAPVTVVWSWWMITAAVITFPVQHWIIRSVVADTPIRSRLILTTALCSVLGLVATLVTTQWRHEIFDSSALAYPIAVGLIPMGSLAVGVARGTIAAAGRFRLLSTVIALENAVRVAAAAVIVAVGSGPATFNMALLAGFSVAIVGPLAAPRHQPVATDASASGSTLGGLVGASFILQLVQSSTPFAVIALGGSSEELTGFFVVLAVARIPQFFANSVSVKATEALTRLVVADQAADLHRIHRMTLTATLAAAALTAAASYFLGSPVLRALFGDDLVFTRAEIPLLLAGGVLAVGVLIFNLSFTAQARSARAMALCGFGAAVGLTAITANIGSVPTRVAAAYLLVQVTVLAGLFLDSVVHGRPHRNQRELRAAATATRPDA